MNLSYYFPLLKEEQVALIRADHLTGHVLDKDFHVFNHRYSDSIERYSVFDTLESAKDYIKEQELKHKNIEYVIYGKGKNVLCVITPESR